MTGHAHSLDEWAAFLSLGVSAWAAMAAVIWLTADADPADFDPRPAVQRALAAVHQGAVHAGHDLNRCLATVQLLARQTRRDAAVTLAALLILTIPTGDHS